MGITSDNQKQSFLKYLYFIIYYCIFLYIFFIIFFQAFQTTVPRTGINRRLQGRPPDLLFDFMAKSPL